MTWFVVAPVAWLCTALALGLLIGRCLRVDGDRQPAAQVVGDGTPVPTAMDDSAVVDSLSADSLSADSRDEALARTV